MISNKIHLNIPNHEFAKISNQFPPCRQGTEYADCILCRGVRSPPPNNARLLAVGGYT